MKKLLDILDHKPALYEQGSENMWNNSHISKGMLKAHLNENLDSATRNIEFVKKSVDWIFSIFPPNQESKLLDLGCGPGIYAELFHDKGYKVTGIDLSERSIKYARNSADSKNLDIQYFLGDYTSIEFNDYYDLITLIYCDLGVLSTATRQKLLKKIYNSLSIQGVFVFDVFKPSKYNCIDESKDWEINENGFWNENKHLLLHSFYRYDNENTFLNQYIVVTQEKISSYNVWEHTFTFEELSKDLKQAGFTNVKFSGNLNGKPCESIDETICILARKE